MTPPLRALLIDDEPPARRWLRELLGAHPEIEIAGEADNIPSAIEAVNRLRPDVIFLDVQMPPGCGFDILPQLVAQPRVIFVTAHDNYAVRAFEMDALDYLLKPVHPERLGLAVKRLSRQSAEVQPPASMVTLTLQDYVPLRDQGMLRMAAVSDIAAIQAEGAYTRVLFSTQPKMLVLRTITEWEKLLPSPPFARLDRSLIINLTCVKQFHVRSRDESLLELRNLPEQFALGRTASTRLRRRLIL